MIALVILWPALLILALVLAGIAYQPARPRRPAQPQCPLHEDCDGSCPDLTVTAAEFATRGYREFEHWQGGAR